MTKNGKAMLQTKHLLQLTHRDPRKCVASGIFSRTSSARGQDEMHVLRRSLQPNVSSWCLQFLKSLDYFGWGLTTSSLFLNFCTSCQLQFLKVADVHHMHPTQTNLLCQISKAEAWHSPNCWQLKLCPLFWTTKYDTYVDLLVIFVENLDTFSSRLQLGAVRNGTVSSAAGKSSGRQGSELCAQQSYLMTWGSMVAHLPFSG